MAIERLEQTRRRWQTAKVDSAHIIFMRYIHTHTLACKNQNVIHQNVCCRFHFKFNGLSTLHEENSCGALSFTQTKHAQKSFARMNEKISSFPFGF